MINFIKINISREPEKTIRKSQLLKISKFFRHHKKHSKDFWFSISLTVSWVKFQSVCNSIQFRQIGDWGGNFSEKYSIPFDFALSNCSSPPPLFCHILIECQKVYFSVAHLSVLLKFPECRIVIPEEMGDEIESRSEKLLIQQQKKERVEEMEWKTKNTWFLLKIKFLLFKYRLREIFENFRLPHIATHCPISSLAPLMNNFPSFHRSSPDQKNERFWFIVFVLFIKKTWKSEISHSPISSSSSSCSMNVKRRRKLVQNKKFSLGKTVKSSNICRQQTNEN